METSLVCNDQINIDVSKFILHVMMLAFKISTIYFNNL